MHKFDRGDPVFLSSLKPVSTPADPESTHNEVISCTVLEVNHVYLVVVLDADSPSQIEALRLTGASVVCACAFL